MSRFTGHTSRLTGHTCRRSARGAVVVAIPAVLLYLFSSLFLWTPVVRAAIHGQGVGTVIKNWYLADQLSYLSISSNVAAGHPAYVEPFTMTGSSIYPSGYYWFLGLFEKLFDVNAFTAWNVVGFTMTIGLMCVVGFWAARTSGNRWGWLFGPVPLVIGTFEWYFTGTWRHKYGGFQAIMWPPFAILNNPGAELCTLTITAFAIWLLMSAFARTGAISVKRAAIAGALAGGCLNIHSYVPLLCIAVMSAMLLLSQVVSDGTLKNALWAAISSAGGFSIAASGIIGTPLARFAAILVGILLPLVVVTRWRARTFKAIIALYGLAIFCGLPLLLRIANQARDKSSFFYQRQHLYDGLDVALPLRPVLVRELPVFILTGLTLVFLWKRRSETKYWMITIGSMLVMSTLLLFSSHWGFNQEPYRFFPYQMVLLIAVAGPWLFTKFTGKTDAAARVLVVVTALLTIPTSGAFYKDTNTLTLGVSSGEQKTYRDIATHLPRKGSVLIDSCISKKLFKVFTSARTTDLNIGLGKPLLDKQVDTVLISQKAGVLVDDAALHSANVTSFLTMNYCSGPNEIALRARFGDPIVVKAADPAYCSLPLDMSYSLYNVKPDSNSAAIHYAPLKDDALPQMAFKPGVSPSQKCGTFYLN